MGMSKKDPRGARTPEVPSSRFDAPSPSSWWSVMRSRGTVRTGCEDRLGSVRHYAQLELVKAHFLREIGYEVEIV